MFSKTTIRVLAWPFVILYVLSLLAERIAPNSWTQTVTGVAFAVIVIACAAVFVVTLPAVRVGIAARIRVAAQRADIIEIPTKNGPRYYAQFPADQKASMLILSEEDITGVEVGPGQKGYRVRRTPEARPTYIRADLPFPTAQRNDELLREYIRQRGGNGK